MAQDRGAPPALAGMDIKHLWAQRGQAWVCTGNRRGTAPASSELPAQVWAGVSHQERQASRVSDPQDSGPSACFQRAKGL